MKQPDWISADGRHRMYCADCLTILPGLEAVDAMICDPPFSDRTHSGHRASAKGQAGEGFDGSKRRALGYAAWTDAEIEAVCKSLPKAGWVCILTDHTLARDWERRMQSVGRYVFAPLPCVSRGRSVRLSGDGPSNWTDWLIVGRTAAEHRWGTLPGCYDGAAGEIVHMGGKPLGMMRAIVADYSKPGDTVLDFCAGSATTGVACVHLGRNFIGIEKDPAHFAVAVRRMEQAIEQQAGGPMFAGVKAKDETLFPATAPEKE